MSASGVRSITRDDLPAVLHTLVRAFDDDPWFNFVVRQDERRRQRLSIWIDRALQRTVALGETYTTNTLQGAALWTPPGHAASSILNEIELRFALLRVAGRDRVGLTRQAVRIINASHHPGPSMDLRIVGVAPEVQGTGIAGALLRPMLTRCNAAGLAVTLLCTKERNVAFYQHLGFKVAAPVAIPDGPQLWYMRREPMP